MASAKKATPKATAKPKKVAPVVEKKVAKKADQPEPNVFVAPRENLWVKKLEQVASALEKRGFATSTVSNLDEARELVLKKILPATKAKKVAFGGSATVLESGLLPALQAVKGLDVANTFDFSIGMEAMIELRRQALLSDLFICSVNALTQDGIAVLLDLIGNRTAAVQFGPKNVVLLVGRNKICKDVAAAVARVREFAAPANAMRLNKKTPCVKTGVCMDCNSPDRICGNWTITSRSTPQGRIHVVLINDEVGF